MDKKFYLHSEFSTKALGSSKSLKIAGYANTVDKDRSGDIVEAAAWAKGLDNFRKNPILLYQHKQDMPIGKVDKVVVDPRGLFIEASVSEAAEKQHSAQTLIKDGALKSFSVGFIAKDGKYNEKTDTFKITEVELLEISIVSIPANQNSVFSIKKALNDEDREALKAKFKSDDSDDVAEPVERVEINLTEEPVIEEKSIEASTQVIEKDEEEEEAVPGTEDPNKLIPFVNLLSANTAKISNGAFVKYNGARYKVAKIATSASPFFKFAEVDLEGRAFNKFLDVDVSAVDVLNIWDSSTKFDLQLVEIKADAPLTDSAREAIKNEFKTLVNMTEQDLYKVKNLPEVVTNAENQEKLNKTINLVSTPVTDWTDTNFNVARRLCLMISGIKQIESDSEFKSLVLKLHGHNLEAVKENKKMTTQEAGEPIVVASTAVEAKTEQAAAAVSVAEPRVAQLIEKAGAAIVREAVAPSSDTSKEVESLRAELKKMSEQVSHLTTSKMVYTEQTRKDAQFSRRDVANAYMLAKALRKDVLDTKLGQRMKAVTTVNQFVSDFSADLYEELQQQLIIAPMFRRINVEAKEFRVPVADEDTDGDVAQFASGTYATGIADNTNVPTSNQHTIKAVTFTPHKFMATTHLAKDEEEDTVLPLIDFLRTAATRRMGRSIDKTLLRGDGSLSGFTASPTSYQSVFKGVATLATDVSLHVGTGGTSTKATAAHIASARALLKKYGLQLGEQLVFLTTIEGYNELVQSSDFRTVDKFGPNATYLTGSLGAIYGIPIMITEFLDNVGVDGNVVGLLMYKPNFLVAERRAMEVESEYDPRRQVTAMYMSTRFDMKALTTNNNSALDTTRYSTAVALRSQT